MTENALLELIRESLPDSPEGMSVGDMAEATGRSIVAIRRDIARLIREGRAECVRATRVAIDGTTRPVPVYRLKCGE